MKLFILTLILFPVIIFGQKKGPSASQTIKLAKEKMEGNKVDLIGASFLWSKAIAENPKCIDCYVERGVCKMYTSRLEDALLDFNYAINQNVDECKSYVYYTYRSRCKAMLKQLDLAIDDINAAIMIARNCGNENAALSYYYYRGIIYEEKEDFSFAISDYKIATKSNEDFAKLNAYNRLSYIYSINYDREPNYQKAIDCKIKVLEIGVVPSEEPFDYEQRLNFYESLIEEYEQKKVLIPNLITEKFCFYFKEFKFKYPDHAEKYVLTNKYLNIYCLK